MTHAKKSTVNDRMIARSDNNSLLECNVCFLTFNTIFSLKKHVKCHCVELPYMCATCGHVFAEETDLAKHFESVTHPVTISYFCTKCRHAFTKKSKTHRCQPHVVDGPNIVRSDNNSLSKCNVCFQTFNTVFSLIKHVNCHCVELPYMCATCGHVFAEETDLAKHSESVTHPVTISYFCTKCRNAFTKKSTIHRCQPHVVLNVPKSEKKGQNFRCKEPERSKPEDVTAVECNLKKDILVGLNSRIACSSEQTSEQCGASSVNENVNIRNEDVGTIGATKGSNSNNEHSQVRLFSAADAIIVGTTGRTRECPVCSKRFYRKELGCIKRHMEWHNKERPFVCDKCALSYFTLSNLDRHIKLKHSDNPLTFQCDKCDKSFVSEKQFNSHYLFHTGERSYCCKECGKSYKTEKEFTGHMLFSHPTERKPYKCSACDKAYTLRCSLNTHFRTHTGEKPYACKYCGMKFILKSYLNMHVARRHPKDNPYKCSMCKERFATKKNCEIHEREHDNETRYYCTDSECNKSFRLKSTLQEHMSVHTGERPYECDVCQKRFRLPQTLTQHYRMHTGKKPYKCNQCDKAFAQLGVLKQHINRNHKITDILPVEGSRLSSVRVEDCSSRKEAELLGKEIRNRKSVAKTLPNVADMKSNNKNINGVGKLKEILNASSDEVLNAVSSIQHNNVQYDLGPAMKNFEETDFVVFELDETGDVSNVMKEDHNYYDVPSDAVVKYEMSVPVIEIKSEFIIEESPYEFDVSTNAIYLNELPLNSDQVISEKPVLAKDNADYSFTEKSQIPIHATDNVDSSNTNSSSKPHDTFKPGIRKRNRQPYQCQKCLKEYMSVKNFKSHISKCQGRPRPFVCDKCGKRFAIIRSLQSHLKRKHSETALLNCDKCDLKFGSKIVLEKHNLFHTGEKKYMCSKCGKPFDLEQKLQIHCFYHNRDSDPRPFKCNICDKALRTQGSLQYHMETHVAERQRFTCKVCDGKFLWEQNLRIHMNIHTGERLYQCETCGKAFRENHGLQRHRNATHAPDRLYSCNKCTKTFTSLIKRNAHVRLHEGKARYECNVCKFSCQTPYGLKTHCRIHTGERPYKCDKCGKSFTTKTTHAIHLRVHTNEKPYHCSNCDQTFRQQGHLRRHEKRHKN